MLFLEACWKRTFRGVRSSRFSVLKGTFLGFCVSFFPCVLNSFCLVYSLSEKAIIMAEPKAEIDLSAPFESVKAAVSMFGEKIPAKTQVMPHPHPIHANHAHPTGLQYVGTYHGPNQAEVLHQNFHGLVYAFGNYHTDNGRQFGTKFLDVIIIWQSD